MVVSCYFNSINKCLIMSSSGEVKYKKENKNVVDFFNKDDELIGRNIFFDFGYSDGYVSLSKIDDKYKMGFSELSGPFVYGNILSTSAHPKSEKLKICEVDIKSKIVQIVCGASNCAENNLAIVAKLDAVMANGMVIVPSKVVNVDSYGMLCSLEELGYSNDQEGIYLQKLDVSKVGMEVEL